MRMARWGLAIFSLWAAAGWAQTPQAGARWVDPDKAEPAGTHYKTFYSETIHGDVSCLIYLPPGYERETGKRYPVAYWLHGLGGNQRSGAVFVAGLEAAIRAGKAPAMIAVLVNGMRDSRYYDSADGRRPVESVIIKDLIQYIDKTYRTIARREDRAIEGYSMGGFGAARLGFKYPELFGAVSIMAGALLDDESVATSMHPELFQKNFGGSKAYFHASSPWVLAEQNAAWIRERTFVRIGIGELDQLLERDRKYHDMLERLGIAHEFFTVPGVAHSSRLFYEKLGERAFRFYEKAFSGESVYQAAVELWREDQEADLRAEGGWLTVAGLFWLKEGENRFGNGAGNDIVLPAGPGVPERAGVFALEGGKVTLRVQPGAAVTAKGKPVETLEMHSDQKGAPDVIALGDLTMHVIERQGRLGIRLKDKNSRTRTEFAGMRWFPIRDTWRVRARFVPYDPPKRIEIPTVLGTVAKEPCPGYAAFTLGGREWRLEPVSESDGGLFFIFRDLTSGKETYGSGRFLDAAAPKDGQVTLDFNEAYNPPCAFTPYATCPLPPKGNRLNVRIEAGEMREH
ncbi:MAG TPA: DUF1684 domain-containing protein [Bryobacterales bacterium]|nr:DUF1684 domain-containing protein [Bryobacterales bacterium]